MSEEQKYNELREQKDKEIQELKQQLAEKTLTIEQINKAFIENRSLWKGKYEQAHQDKISFAVKQLEKLKKFTEKEIKECNKLLQEEFEDDYYIQSVNARQSMCYEFKREIDNQINVLRRCER